MTSLENEPTFRYKIISQNQCDTTSEIFSRNEVLIIAPKLNKKRRIRTKNMHMSQPSDNPSPASYPPVNTFMSQSTRCSDDERDAIKLCKYCNKNTRLEQPQKYQIFFVTLSLCVLFTSFKDYNNYCSHE